MPHSLPDAAHALHHRRDWWVEQFLLLRRAARELGANDPLRLGAATAFFTSFALPPIVIILVQLLGSVYSANGAQLMLLTKLSQLIGSSAAGLVAQTVHNVANAGRGNRSNCHV